MPRTFRSRIDQRLVKRHCTAEPIAQSQWMTEVVVIHYEKRTSWRDSRQLTSLPSWTRSLDEKNNNVLNALTPLSTQ
ncbi:hypothetical protein BgiMline_015637 [Biomphalaria glabrata]|nr:hypothetical protein BgiMline_008457 [Biomphalaria glabrata]